MSTAPPRRPDPSPTQPTARPASGPAQGQQRQVAKATSPFRIVSSSTFKERYLNMLLYGPYGVGKTHLAGSAQDVDRMKNVLFIDAESGGLTLAKRGDVDSIRVENYRHIQAIYEFLRAHCVARDKGDTEALVKLDQKYRDPDSTEPKIYHTVVMDSLTEMAKFSLYMLLNIDIGAAQLIGTPDMPEFKEWGQNTELIRLLIRTFRDLPMNFICVCAEKDDQNERKQVLKTPLLPPALARELPGFFDVVGYYTAGFEADNQRHRKVFFNPGRTWLAKHRFGAAVPDFIEDPTMEQILNLLPE